MCLKINNIFKILILLSVMLFPVLNANAKNSYIEALREIVKVAPLGEEEVIKDYEEDVKPDVEFSMNNVKFLKLTLKDSLIIALNSNYDIRIAKMDPTIKEKDIKIAKSEFDPLLSVTGESEDSEVASNSGVLVGVGGSATDFRRDTNTLNATLETLIATGATVTMEFDVSQEFVDPVSAFTLNNPVAESEVTAKFTQPILKNAGIFYNRSDIHIARNDKKRSILELKETAIEVINSTQKAYWELVKSIEELRVRRKSLERAEDLLKKNKIQVKVGTLAPIELLVAEEGVTGQMEGVVVAENDIKDREDDLKQIMNLSNNALLSDVSIVPLDRASFKDHNISLQESIGTALKNRPEVFEQGLDIENARIKVMQKKNQLLPKLDFEAGIRYQGLAGNKGNAIDRALSQDFQSEFYGIMFEVPLGNREARSNYSKAKLEERQTIFNTRKIRQEIVVEVRKAVRQIKTNAERIKASRKAKELSQERLVAEEKKFKVGRSTSLEVIRAQVDLAVSEGRATNALVDYQISLGDLDAVLGTILENNNIIIDDKGI
ncbi:MAG: TolC family protein [Candidatus Scalindua sp.]|jgi:outer membrane protein TolC|nr:TolC family protein [Candidatus Scalindua sp.]MDV5166097.1 TolC family protein [Candidatus Scalindua sp.]